MINDQPPASSSSAAPVLPPPPETGPSSATPVVLSPPHTVHAVSLKLPTYWPNDPIVWFAQVEAQFLTRNITSQSTQFAYVIASLPPEIAQEIRDLLIYPPTENLYDVLKATLIRRTSASEQKRLHQLLIAEELGDRQPSQLLRKMRQLLGDTVLEDGILHQFIQLILASTPSTMSLEELSLLADRILGVASPPPSVVAVSNHLPLPTMPEHHQQIADLQVKINQLSAQLQVLSTQLDSRDPPCFRGRSPSRSRFPRLSFSCSPSQPHLSPYCWYHERFGAAAIKCNPPYTFLSSSQPPASHPGRSHQSENFPASH